MTGSPPAGHVVEAGGLQNERTALAWVRTSLSIVGAGALLAKAVGSEPVLAAIIVVLALAAGGALHVSADRTRRRRTVALAEGRSIVAPTPLLATAIATSVLAVVAAAVIVFPR